MKKISLLFVLFFVSVQLAFSQTVPQGMKYQAVARDLSGDILTDQDITLKIELQTGLERPVSVYSEIHQIKTNQLGLFTLTIGEGDVALGRFEQVPWSQSDIWMKISIQEDAESEFLTISNSKMLSVPYAFHAATASEITGSKSGSRGPTPGVNSQNWSLFGNSSSDPDKDKLGTTDMADLVLVTNNIERMRIFTDGNIEMARSLTIGENLTVKQNTSLNTEGGQTINYGPFTVENQSPTLLSGSLTVDLFTDLNSSLNVDGITDLNSALRVNNMSPTTLSGTLLTMDDATFKEHVLIDNPNYNSFSKTQGALVVHGGVGIGKNLNVGGDAKFEGHVEINGPLALTDPTESTSPTTGALTVVGGVGIQKNINVGGAAVFGVDANSSLSGYPMIVQGSAQGIAVKVTGSRNNANDFVSFHDDHGQWGAIEGQTIPELVFDPEYIVDKGFYLFDIAVTGAELGVSIVEGLVAVAELAQAVIELAAASTSSTGCGGLGACVTAPIPSLIVGETAGVVLATANLVTAIANTVIIGINATGSIAQEVTHDAFRFAQIGVTYSSGAGDYAEWLPKLNPKERLQPGDIVGVQGGYITKRTAGAEYVMVVSQMPIVLGNKPELGSENDFEKVAFMGQVPVRVLGKVKVGDYILPSGLHDGFGRAVAPNEMRPEDYLNIVGIAWTSNDQSKVGFVNVAVGLNSNDVTKLVIDQNRQLKLQQDQVNELQAQVDLIRNLLFDLASGKDDSEVVEKMEQLGLIVEFEEDEVTGERKVVYFEVDGERFVQAYDLVKNQLMRQGVDVQNHPFFSQLDQDAQYKAEVLGELKAMVDQVALEQFQTELQSGALVELDYDPRPPAIDKSLEKMAIKMGFEAAKSQLEAQGVNLEEHPFFKKLNQDPNGEAKLMQELETRLLNPENH